MLENKMMSLNLQLFAEADPVNGNEVPPKTYSEQEYKKLKDSLDKTSSELANLKKERQSKLSEDEKRAEEREELLKQLESYKKMAEDSKIEKELLKGGFTSEEVEKIIKDRDDFNKLSTTLGKIFKEKLEQEKKKWEEEIMQKDVGVKGQGGGEESVAVTKAKQSSKKQEEVKWGSF